MSKIITFIKTFNKRVITIIKNKKNLAYKLSLLSILTKITTKTVLTKIIPYKPNKQSILGYKVNFLDIGAFASLFEEIFIQEIYDFKTTKTSPVIVDCGSNIGMSVLYFKIKYPKSEIIAFEADKKSFLILEKNIKENNLKNVRLINAAVYDKKGELSFFTEKNKDGSLSSSVTKRITEFNREIKETIVPSVKLSGYINKEVDFLKVDIEGAEAVVLTEAKTKLKLVNEIFIEYHNNKINPKNRLNIITNILEQTGFNYFIWGKMPPPFYQWKNKPYNLIIYAYRLEK